MSIFFERLEERREEGGTKALIRVVMGSLKGGWDAWELQAACGSKQHQAGVCMNARTPLGPGIAELARFWPLVQKYSTCCRSLACLPGRNDAWGPKLPPAVCLRPDIFISSQFRGPFSLLLFQPLCARFNSCHVRTGLSIISGHVAEILPASSGVRDRSQYSHTEHTERRNDC